MDVFTALNSNSVYSKTQLQMIVGAWVLTGLSETKSKVSVRDGDVSEDDYDKRSIYSLLYALYSSMGEVRSETGERYEFTFNTWGYAWPDDWGAGPAAATDPQRYGKNAYAGLYQAPAAQAYVRERHGRVHVVEMGCGTGAGAHFVCTHVLPECTYHAVDMQKTAIQTCERKFVPALGGRLTASCADATAMPIGDGVADFVAVNETHVTEMTGRVTDEDARFFRAAHRALKPNGLLAWGNAIPDATWQPCFDYLASIGIKVLEVRDVTREAVRARDDDKRRIDAYVNQCIETFFGFRIPYVGPRKRREAEIALKNFARNPGTKLYQNMVDGTDSYRVVLAQKTA